MPSGGIVRVLAEFDVGVQGARSALSRLTGRGLLQRTKRGRRTYYALTPQAIRVLKSGAERIFGLGSEAAAWDGTWSVVAFTIPESDRGLRNSLRTNLRWLTFAPLYDGVWISPHPRLEAAEQTVRRMGISSVTLFRARAHPERLADGELLKAWDLEGLARRYQDFIIRFRPLQDRVLNNQVGPPEAMVARTRVMDAYRVFPADDPDLPEQLLPASWPRNEAGELALDIYERLRPAAEEHFHRLLDES